MKSIFGLSENIAAAISYIFGPFSGIVVLIMERENKFVRFHALQSTLWFLFLMIAGWMMNIIIDFLVIIPILGWIAGAIVGVIAFAAWILYVFSKIYLILKAYQGAVFKLPIIGDVAWNQVNS